MSKRMIIKTALIMATLTVVLFLCSCGTSAKNIKLSDYVSIETEGLSGSGIVKNIVIDNEGLTEALGGKEHIQDVYLKVMKNKDAKTLDGNTAFVVSTFSDLFKITADKTEGLSNGDTVTLTAEKIEPYNGAKTNELLYKYLAANIKDASIVVDGLFVPYTTELFDESHVERFSEYMAERVKKDQLAYGESVSSVHITEIDHLVPKEGQNAEEAFYISAIVTIRLSDGRLFDKDFRILTKSVSYSNDGTLNINGEFRSNFQLSYLDKYNINPLYTNPAN